MIRKPAGDWGRESAAVTTARTVASTGVTVVKTGMRTVRGIFLCGFGAMWVLGGLGGLASGSIAALVGGCVVGGILIVLGLRSIKGPKAETEAAPFAPTAGSRPIAAAAIDYSRRKLVNQCMFAGIGLLGGLWGAGHLHGVKHLAALFLIPMCGLLIALSARRVLGDLTALRWDAQGLTVASLWTRRAAAWSQVQSITLDEVSTYALYGLLRIGSNRSLTVRFTDGRPGKLSISSGLLDLQDHTLESLALTLQAAQMGRGAPRNGWESAPAAGNGFAAAPPQRATRPAPAPAAVDADAAIARYMAEQARAQPQYTSPAPTVSYGGGPARATFGRRGL